MAKAPNKPQKKTKSPITSAPAAGAGKVPAKGGASVAQESGSRNAPIINIGIDRQDRAAIAEGLSRVIGDLVFIWGLLGALAMTTISSMD